MRHFQFMPCLSLVVLVEASRVLAYERGDDVLADLAMKAARQTAAWTSIDLRINVRLSGQRPYRSDSLLMTSIEYHYTETSDGWRFLDVQPTYQDGSRNRRTSYCDGEKCANVIFDLRSGKERQDNIVISHFFMNERSFGATDRPQPIKYFYVGKVPLHEALPRAERIGTSRRIGRDCTVVLFRSVKWASVNQTLVYYLDNETGVPLKVDSFRTDDDPARGVPLWVWEAKSAENYQGFTLPLESESYSIRDGNKVNARSIKILEVEYNKPFSRESFWPAYEDGVTIVDTVSDRVYVHTSRKPSAESEPSSDAEAGSFIAAEQPSDWTTIITWLVIGVSLILLFSIVLIVMRRSR